MSIPVSQSLLLHPITLITFEILTTAIVIGFTTPSSILRPALLPLVATATFLTLVTCPIFLPRFWITVVAGNAPTYLLRYIELALLSRWSYAANGPTSITHPRARGKPGAGKENDHLIESHRNATAWKRLRFGLDVTLFPRRIGTPFEVRNIPSLAEARGKASTQTEFLWRTSATVFICYLIVDFSLLAAPDPSKAILFSEEKVPFLIRLNRVSAEEVAIRIFSSLALCINIICFMNIGYGVMALVGVGLGLTEPSAWRPAFGSPKEAYSLQRFWSVFWHQMLTPTFSYPADYVTYKILRLPKASPVARYIRVFLSFFICGLLHLYVDVAGGIPWYASGSLHFFCTQAIGIILESSFQALWKWFFPPANKVGSKPQSPGWTRVAGYVWTAAFLVWSAPVYSYVAIRQDINSGDTQKLPFSIAQFVRESIS